MSSCVRLAAWMPAMRAAPSTSPFLALPLRTSASVFGAMITRPSATATRSVAAFAETSTMRASPLRLRWVSFLVRRGTVHRMALAGERRAACQQRTRRRCDVVLTHQALADEESENSGAGETRQVVRREYSAFADDDAVAWDKPRQPLAGCKRGRKCFQIAIVDADKL